MKNLTKYTAILALASSMALTSCIEEVQPTQSISQEQLQSSVKAGEAMIMAMPAMMINWNTVGAEWHGDFGFSSLMHMRDCMTADMSLNPNGANYNQWSNYTGIRYLGQNYASTQRIWNIHTRIILACNKAASVYTEDMDDDYSRGARATALAFRAMLYLDFARWYEFLPNNNTSAINQYGNDVTNLTVPIVTEKTTEEEARNNPRATRQEMFDFILSDLNYAEENISNANYGTLTLPDLACVYGLKARLYTWVEDYAKAAEYARMAIAQSGATPLSESEWLDPAYGFNSFNNNSWLWGMKFEKENDAVQTGICNWTSMMSAEANYGYAGILDLPYLGAGACPTVANWMYDRIPDTDFRKLSWIAPYGSSLSGQTPVIDEASRTLYEKYGPYCAIKFRPGDGNQSDYNVGSATAVPVMRVEEMYFIEMEAIAHSNPAEGKRMLEEFMTTYRDPAYTCDVNGTDDVVEEIVFQKRVELWGEGTTLFDIKRLNYSVTRQYDGTNFLAGTEKNTIGRPAWANMVIVQTEGNTNEAVTQWNNPDIPDTY